MTIARSDRSLVTVLFTDIVGSTKQASRMGDGEWRKLLDRHDAMVRETLSEHGGREIRTMGDGFVAVFDAPVRAIDTARAIAKAAPSLSLQIRAGIHTGECEIRGDDIGGIAVHVAARVAALAGAGEVWVSNTVRDLSIGADYFFESRGSHTLKGVPRKWRLFAPVESRTSETPALNSKAKTRKSAPAKVPPPSKTASRTAGHKRASAKAVRTPHVPIMLVDDHPLWRQTLRSVLEGATGVQVIAEASNGESALQLVKTARPKVVVMDVDMPKMGGIECVQRMRERYPDIRVLMLSSSDEQAKVLSAIRAGASGYLLKTSESKQIEDAVRRIVVGEVVFPPELSHLVLSALRGEPSAEPQLTVALAADSLVAGEGLAKVTLEAGFRIAGHACKPKDLPAVVAETRPDVALLDVGVRFGEGGAARKLITAIRNANKSTGIVVLTESGDTSTLELADGDRGIGLLLKERISEAGELADAIKRVAAGESVLDHQIAAGLVKQRRQASLVARLSDREREALELMAEGRSNLAICERLHVSPKTVEGYVASIFTKLGLEPAEDDHRRVLAVVTYLRSCELSERRGPPG
ncbi:MAG: hypothetical protein NVSMB57_12280 [Actinomycetota bacterium]